MANAPLPNTNVPVLGPDGQFTLPWRRWFQALSGVSGAIGPEGPSGPEGPEGPPGSSAGGDVLSALALGGLDSGVLSLKAGPGILLTPDPISRYGIIAAGASGGGGGGEDGEDGAPGPPGAPGPAGAAGAPGAVGPQGPIGFGLDGSDGEELLVPGPMGPTGPQGPAGSGLYSGLFGTLPTLTNTGLANTAGSFSTAPANTAAGIYLLTTSAAALYTTSVPSTPYSITALLTQNAVPNQGLQIGWTDTTKYQRIIWGGNSIAVQNLSALNTFSANVFGPTAGLTTPFIWVKIRDDGTNISFSVSMDGVNFSLLYTVVKSAGFLGSSGYSHIMVGCAGNGNGTVMAWIQGV